MQDRGKLLVGVCGTTSRMSVWQDGARSQAANSVGEQTVEIPDTVRSQRLQHLDPAAAVHKQFRERDEGVRPGALRQKECKYRKTEKVIGFVPPVP